MPPSIRLDRQERRNLSISCCGDVLHAYLPFERSESPQGQPFDWKWKVEAVNGALVETKDEFAQVAPEEGYMPAWETSQAANAQSFRKNGQARFYVRTADNRPLRPTARLSRRLTGASAVRL